MANPMVVNLTQYTAMRASFQEHYFLTDCDTDFGGQDIQVSWSSFNSAVQDFITDTGATPSTVALRFVLCYDPNINEIFLRMQICTMTATNDPVVFNLDTTDAAWYKIQNGVAVTTTTDTDLYDQNYLDYFYYCDSGECDPNTLVNLASDTGAEIFVQNIVFP